jgi:hypothetical protein
MNQPKDLRPTGGSGGTILLLELGQSAFPLIQKHLKLAACFPIEPLAEDLFQGLVRATKIPVLTRSQGPSSQEASP